MATQPLDTPTAEAPAAPPQPKRNRRPLIIGGAAALTALLVVGGFLVWRAMTDGPTLSVQQMRSLLAQERFAGRAVSIEGTASTPLDDASVEANSADFKDGPAVCADASVHSLKHVIFSGFGTAASPSEGVQVVLYDTAAANREASELFDKCSVAQGYDFTSDTVKGSVRGADWAYLPGSLEVLYGNLHVTVIPQGGEAPQVSDAEALADAVVRQVDANR